MGLDMYLVKSEKPFENNSDLRYDDDKTLYWRKFNALHFWFVNNVQNGNDDCGYYEVSKEKLEELIKTLKEVDENHIKAHELLPTAKGFFFGATNYDEYYFQDVKNAIEKLEGFIEEGKYYTYTSSW